MYYPNTLDQRRIANANGRVLLQNWVEERAVEPYDKIPAEYQEKNVPSIKFFKNGHQGILSLEQQKSLNTTYTDDYIRKNKACNEAKGIRYQTMEREIKQQLINEMEQGEKMNDPNLEPIDYTSEAHSHYVVPGFVSIPPKPTTRHDVYAEMPVSYWTERKNRAHGVTQFKTLDSPFRRNAAFSTPITESYGHSQPGELENYPYMSQKGHNNAAIL